MEALEVVVRRTRLSMARPPQRPPFHCLLELAASVAPTATDMVSLCDQFQFQFSLLIDISGKPFTNPSSLPLITNATGLHKIAFFQMSFSECSVKLAELVLCNADQNEKVGVYMSVYFLLSISFLHRLNSLLRGNCCKKFVVSTLVKKLPLSAFYVCTANVLK